MGRSRNPSRDLRLVMAKKRNTEDFERTARSASQPSWDDGILDPEASTYLFAEARGPEPVPDWVIVADAARQYDLGVLKTGKEADVHLVERRIDDEVNILAAKRYRAFEDRLFRNDARYRGARRTGDSRLDKAIARGNNPGMAFRARLWVQTEFEVLCRLWSAGAPVPYPIQKLGNEVLVELIGSAAQAAPRLVHARLSPMEVEQAWGQLHDALRLMARMGVVHGDLSPYNILWDDGRLVIIDFPQAVDPIVHPDGMALLERDVTNMCDWFGRRGVPCDASSLFADLLGEIV